MSSVTIGYWYLSTNTFSRSDSTSAKNVSSADIETKRSESSQKIGFHVFIPTYIPQGLAINPKSAWYEKDELSSSVTYGITEIGKKDGEPYAAITVIQTSTTDPVVDMFKKTKMPTASKIELKDGTLAYIFSNGWLFFEKSNIAIYMWGAAPLPSGQDYRTEMIKVANSLQ